MNINVKTNTHVLGIRVSPTMKEAVERRAQQEGISLSELIRDALSIYLDDRYTLERT